MLKSAISPTVFWLMFRLPPETGLKHCGQLANVKTTLILIYVSNNIGKTSNNMPSF